MQKARSPIIELYRIAKNANVEIPKKIKNQLSLTEPIPEEVWPELDKLLPGNDWKLINEPWEKQNIEITGILCKIAEEVKPIKVTLQQIDDAIEDLEKQRKDLRNQQFNVLWRACLSAGLFALLPWRIEIYDNQVIFNVTSNKYNKALDSFLDMFQYTYHCRHNFDGIDVYFSDEDCRITCSFEKAREIITKYNMKFDYIRGCTDKLERLEEERKKIQNIIDTIADLSKDVIS